MSIRGWKSLALFLAVISFSLLICCGFLFVQNHLQWLHTNFADETTKIIQDMRNEALATDDPHRAANYLGYAINYYPSGTKQLQGSHLDTVVERQREDAVIAILRHLRELTGEDLGNDPDPWMKKFSTHP